MLCDLFNEQYLPDNRKYALLCEYFVVLPVSVSKFQLNEECQIENWTRLTDEHVDGRMRITTTDIKPDTERLLRQQPYKMSH